MHSCEQWGHAVSLPVTVPVRSAVAFERRHERIEPRFFAAVQVFTQSAVETPAIDQIGRHHQHQVGARDGEEQFDAQSVEAWLHGGKSIPQSDKLCARDRPQSLRNPSSVASQAPLASLHRPGHIQAMPSMTDESASSTAPASGLTRLLRNRVVLTVLALLLAFGAYRLFRYFVPSGTGDQNVYATVQKGTIEDLVTATARGSRGITWSGRAGLRQLQTHRSGSRQCS